MNENNEQKENDSETKNEQLPENSDTTQTTTLSVTNTDDVDTTSVTTPNEGEKPEKVPSKHTGRPSEYSPEVLKKTEEYLINYEQHGDAFPSVASLSIILGRPRKTVYEWAKTNPEFRNILELILSTQEKTVLNKSIKNEFNATISKLVLGKHGYSDKQDLTSNGKEILTSLKETPDADLEHIAITGTPRVSEEGVVEEKV